MKIVNISNYIPWPLHFGGSEAQFFFLRELSANHEVSLIVPVTSDRVKQNLAELQEQLPRVKIYGADCSPIGKLDRLTGRIHSWYATLSRLKAKFKRNSPERSISAAKISMPVEVLHPNYVKAISQHAWDCDVVQVDFLETISAAFLLPANIPKVFLNHQVQSVFDTRLTTNDPENLQNQYFSQWNRLLEGELMKAYDAVMVFSNEDKTVIAREYGCMDIYVSPFPFSNQVDLADRPLAPDGRTFLFLGMEGHIANRDGLGWFLDEVWPHIIKAQATVRLQVFGKWSKNFQLHYGHLPNIKFCGHVPDLKTAMKGGILVSPIRVGSGVRVKILTAMALGIPVVSTTVGCEGINLKNGEGVIIADSASDFAAAAMALLQSPEQATLMAELALTHIRTYFSRETALKRRLQVLNSIIEKKKSQTSGSM